ncbi:MAG: bifunctional DNA-formamidopyrimidine glycosylase/DNA-(apurinic or apyrimidinic site) lyase [bacterium]|nr:bifunctional DNA-formamidopyrimidine glycosylase/DNA-(apurinic or apyrimidinic site) lyase [bacterium]
MPELPEVENVARAMSDALLGKRLDGIRVTYAGALKPTPRKVRSALLGLRLNEVMRHGKYIFLGFGHDVDDVTAQLLLHLRMTGQVFVQSDYRPDKHVHLFFDFEGRVVFYRDIRKFGGFELLDGAPGAAAIPHVGQDMLLISRRDWLLKIGKRTAPIKVLLLNQGIAAGLGNIYADEALHRAGVHPLARPVDLDVKTLARVFRESRRVLRQGIKHGGTTFQDFVDFTGKPGNFRDQLRVYGRTGEPCPVCSGKIVRLKVGGRSSHYCAVCQPE